MPDLRPVAHIIGLMLMALGVMMLIPMGLALAEGDAGWAIFLQSAAISLLAGTFLAISTANAVSTGLTLRQSFLLTTLTWVVLPTFGALPFFLGPEGVRLVDALFEAVSGMTTTGTTIMVGLDGKPAAILVRRSILQWLGGLGIVIVALVFLPVMRVGGMQYFRAEGFDTLGKILPRVRDISVMLIEVYLALTVATAVAYGLAGMNGFDAVNHAMTTVATGGFSTRDASFADFPIGTHYVAVAAMWLSGLPFIRYIQLVNGEVRPLWSDVQVRAFLRWTLYAIALIAGYRLLTEGGQLEPVIRESAFTLVSLMTGTGYGAADITAWGDFVLLVVLVAGFIGACTASTGCSIKVFRYLVLFEAIKVQLRELIHPSRVAPIHLQGRRVEQEVITSVVVLFTAFVLGFGLLAVGLTLTGLEMRTAITAAWTAICNIGPAFGPGVGPTGAVSGFPDSAKWLMMLGMLAGRLEMVAVLVMLLPRFWRP